MKKQVLGLFVLAFTLVGVACSEGVDDYTEMTDQVQEELNRHDYQEIELPYGLLEEVVGAIVAEIVEVDGNVKARLIPNEPSHMFMETPSFLGLGEGPIGDRRVFATDFDNSTLWLESGSVEIEEGNGSLIDATILDVAPDDVLRLYIREVEVPWDEWGGSGSRNLLEKVVIIR